ncbi:MAG TPA: hypothetical protein VIL28_16575, partial [Steroidobacteraceae bacterium]
LLSLRDGEPVDAAVRAHVAQCATCLAESARLACTREQLRCLPAIEPPRDFWPRIEARVAEQPKSRNRFALAIAAALACIVFGAIAVIEASRDRIDSQPLANTEDPQNASSTELDELIAQSRRLEAMLEALPARPHVERVSTAVTVDSLERRIQWLDWQLTHGSETGLDQRQAERLWSQRVELMDSLVKVRYAESVPSMF